MSRAIYPRGGPVLASVSPRSPCVRIAIASVFVFGIFSAPASTRAADYWTGASNLYWNTPSNWSLAAVPSSGQTAVFDSGTSTAWASNIVLRATSGTAAGIRFIGSTGYQLNPDYSAGVVTLTLATGELWNQATSGTQTIAIPLVLGTNGTFAVDSTGSNLVISGGVGENASGRSVAKSGGGTLVMYAASTYTGGTTLSAGTLRAGHDGALGSGSLTLAGGTFASADASARAFSNAVSVAGNTTLGDATGTGSLTFSGTMDLGGNTRTLTSVSNVTISGAVSNGGLTKSGAGTLTLSGSHGYTGPTTVQAGTLAVNGTIASSAVSVASGATLKGNAFIGSSLTVSGTLSPGNSPGTVTAGSLTLQPGSTTLMEIVGVTSGTSALPGSAGTDYDTIVVTGSSGPAYGGALSIQFSSTNPFADGTTFDLFRFTGTTSGSFASIATVGSGLYANLSFGRNADGAWYSGDTSGHQFLRFDPLTGDLVVVPEPSTWLMAAAGVALAGGLKRRRRT